VALYAVRLHVNGSAYASDDTASASVSAAAVIWILMFEPFLRIGEDERVLFFPPEMLDRAVTAATETERREAYERELLLQKKYRFRDIYPLSPARGVRQEQEAAVNLTFLLWRELHEHVCNVSALGH